MTFIERKQINYLEPELHQHTEINILSRHIGIRWDSHILFCQKIVFSMKNERAEEVNLKNAQLLYFVPLPRADVSENQAIIITDVEWK